MLGEALLASSGRCPQVRTSGRSGFDMIERERLRILIVLPSLAPGGAERVTVNLANGLLAAGASPSVLLTDRTGPLESRLNAEVALSELGRPRVRGALPGVIGAIRRQRPDVVLSTHTHVNLALCAARPILPRSTRLVIRIPIHAPETLEGRSTAWSRRAQRVVYRAADLVLATSATMAADLREFLVNRVEVLENPVDESEVRASVTETPSPTRPGRRFIMVGRLRPQKAIDDLITAFAMASDPEDLLEIVGEGPERPRLERLIRSLGLNGRVTLSGAQPDPWDRVARADAFFLPSRHEGMPNVVLESLCLGTPVIATDELEVLTSLRTKCPSGAVTLVERSELAAAIGSVRPTPVGAPIPRPSLLPPTNRVGAVVARFLELIASLASP